MIYRFSIFIFLIGLLQNSQAQEIVQISTLWDDRLDEWIIYTDIDELEGKIEPKWPLRNDGSEWFYELGDDVSGTIKQTWRGNFNSWDVITSENERIEIKAVWKNDFSIWKISFQDEIYRLKSNSRFDPMQWEIQKSDEEEFLIYMDVEGEPRDWIVENFLKDQSPDLCISIAFISILNSLPIN